MAAMNIKGKQGKMLLISRFFKVQIIVFLLFLADATAETIALSPTFPETHKTVKISCYSIEDRIWYHNGKYKTTCNKNMCSPAKDPSRRYAFTADEDKTEVTITFLKRTHDSGVWMCHGERKNTITLEVYSFPLGLSLLDRGNTEGDLAIAQVTLECQTIGCTYPVPHIKWYYKDVTELASPTSYKETGMGKVGVCISPEQLYTSSITLPLHTTWQDNNNKSVTFSCGMNYFNYSKKYFLQSLRK